MRPGMPDGLCSIPSATGGIARLACARLRELGNDVAAVLAEVGARPEQVNDDAIRLEVPKQIRILELASEELQDGLLGFHLARNFDLRDRASLLCDRIIGTTCRCPAERKAILHDNE